MVVPKKDTHDRWLRCKQLVIVLNFTLIFLQLLPHQEGFEIQEPSNELLLVSNSNVANGLNPPKMKNTAVMELSSIQEQKQKQQQQQQKQQQGDETTRSIQIGSNKPVEEGQGWRKTLPLANFRPTTDTQYEVCFVTSVYSSSIKQADRPPTVQAIQDQNPSFRFFAFTNLPNLEAPGWNLRVKPLDQYKRQITQSRWAKFMAWEDPEILLCQAVIYMDGFCRPKEKHSERYKRMAKAIFDSPEGLFQNRHEVDQGPIHELNRILAKKKDIRPNVEASKAWLEEQPDFDPSLPMYVNTFIGYNPKNERFQQVARFFWNRYSLELDSWRDQPLWSFALHKYQMHPTKLGTYKALFQQVFRNMGHAGHRYNKRADSAALITTLDTK